MILPAGTNNRGLLAHEGGFLMLPAVQTTTHPLFDPASRYSSYRKCFSTGDKMHGYLLWVARTALKDGGVDLAATQAVGLAAANYQPRRLYFLTDGTDLTQDVSA